MTSVLWNGDAVAVVEPDEDKVDVLETEEEIELEVLVVEGIAELDDDEFGVDEDDVEVAV
jgi:hypothetical protein